MQRDIIIGDIHGCLGELESLLNKVHFDPKADQVYSVGDFINRGPDSRGVFKKLVDINCKSILGNHEYQLLKRLKRYDKTTLTNCWGIFKSDFDSFRAYLENLPIYIENDNFIMVHAGLIADEPINQQDPDLLTTIRTVDALTGKIPDETGLPWFEFYQANKLIVFGHWAQLGGIDRHNIVGLDTGCVYGRKLSALILPENKIVSVAAKRIYHHIKYNNDIKNK